MKTNIGETAVKRIVLLVVSLALLSAVLIAQALISHITGPIMSVAGRLVWSG